MILDCIQMDKGSKTQIVHITAVSGVAFAIISRGKTTHFCFKIPIDAVAELLHKPQLLLLDETPMTKTIVIKNIDKLLKDVMENDEDFGGKMVVFCEDFRQVLIVVLKITIYQTIFTIEKYEKPNNTKSNIKISKDMIIEYDNEKNSILQLIRAIFPNLIRMLIQLIT
ncbi:hypothetical protein Pfo_000525 [Paulownia fortunei]|nr:hypothetical protein Pfo_000525 [Paulownia fortunei]